MSPVRFHKLSEPKRRWTHHPTFPVILSFLLTIGIGTPLTLWLQSNRQERQREDALREERRNEEEALRRTTVREAVDLVTEFDISIRKVINISRQPRLHEGKRDDVLQEWSESTARWDARSEVVRQRLLEVFPSDSASSPPALFDSLRETSASLEATIDDYSEVVVDQKSLSKMTEEACAGIPREDGVGGRWCEAIGRWESFRRLFKEWQQSTKSWGGEG